MELVTKKDFLWRDLDPIPIDQKPNQRSQLMGLLDTMQVQISILTPVGCFQFSHQYQIITYL